MLKYVLSDDFATRFKGIAEVVTALRSHQNKERQWHAETWAKQTRLHDEMDANRRDITAQVRAIAEAPGKARLRVVAGDG